MHKLFDLPADQDLSAFAGYLWQQKIAHRILYRNGCQELWLARAEDAGRVLDAFERWRNGTLAEVEVPVSGTVARQAVWKGVSRCPVTFALIALSVLLTLLIGFGDDEVWLQRLAFVYFSIESEYVAFESLERMFARGEYWRLITPMFLHFSLLHIVFNLLWTWELGRRIERLQPSWWLLTLALAIGALSNVAQFMMTGPLFGGLSGVVFGLLAYTWLWDRLNPQRRFGLPPALMGFMVVWLIVGVSGVLEKMGFGSIANTAHLVGLLGGLLGVLPALWLFRRR